MRCEECLAELATGSLRDLRPDSPVAQHCASCPDCGPLATMLRDREYNAATVLNNLPPMSNPIDVAQSAAMMSRRRRVGKVAVFFSGAALVATIWVSLFLTDFGRQMFTGDRAVSNLETETIPLVCLSPKEAGEIVSPYFRTRGSAYSIRYIGESRLAAITVRGTAHQIARARASITEFETNANPSCRADIMATKLKEMQDALERAGEPGDPAPVLAPSPDLAPPARKK